MRRTSPLLTKPTNKGVSGMVNVDDKQAIFMNIFAFSNADSSIKQNLAYPFSPNPFNYQARGEKIESRTVN